MARGKRGGDSVGGWFRELYTKQPDLLKQGTNADVIALWEKAHAGQRMDERVKGIMANVKSQMRKKMGLGKLRGRRRRRKVALDGAAGGVMVAAKPRASRLSLEDLEGAIDDCMAMAKNINRERLVTVLQHLRKARNLVVYELGEK